MKSSGNRPGFMEDPQWYKDAVIYQVHVKSFFDANDDGIGDFPGLIQKLDYITGLGVNTLWLLPFYPSPRRDDGYDIADYRNVHPDYGSLADVRRLISETHRRGMRIITELVINHTSDQHPWFQRARRAKKGSRARDWYVWSDDPEKYAGARIIFIDSEPSNWTWDPVAGQYFWHRFYSHQPDLNYDNPQVLRAVLSIMRFWLDMGVDGLRLDAIPYLVERDGTNSENLPETHAVLKRFRAELDTHYPHCMLLAEANQWPEDACEYFGDGDECHMAFHFPLMPRMYMAIAQEDRYPITDILRQTPKIPDNCQWAIFLRNHDELTLEMVTEDERDYLWNYYAADHRARINLGIRRRLAPLVDRDRRRIELLHSLLLSMPGTPTLYYGDELGMGDNIYLGDRDGVRTPMQWSMDRNGGFSRADPARLVLPLIMDPLYGYQTINVEAQSHDHHSLLNWMRRMLNVRGQTKAFGCGEMHMLTPSNRRVLAYLREYPHPQQTETVLCVVNLSRAAQAVELDLSGYHDKVPVEMLGGAAFPPIGQMLYQLTLPPYGFYWFFLADSSQMPNWHETAVERMPELSTLVLPHHQLDEIMQPNIKTLLENDILPLYLPRRRWYAGQQTRSGMVRLDYAVPLGTKSQGILLCELHEGEGDSIIRYQLPLAIVPERSAHIDMPQKLAMARVRHGAKIDLLTDAISLPAFSQEVLRLILDEAELTGPQGKILFRPHGDIAVETEWSDDEVKLISAEQSNSSARIGDKLMIKLIRRVFPGIHPEVEMGRFLARQGFTHTSQLLGDVYRETSEGEPITLMLLQEYLDNQGDAWSWTQNNLERVIRNELSDCAAELETDDSAMAELESFAGLLGQRVGEMHQALAQPDDDPNFGFRFSDEDDAQRWSSAMVDEVRRTLKALNGARDRLQDAFSETLEWLFDQERALLEMVEKLAEMTPGGLMIRVHGDLHLGQVLVVRGDAYIIDFEGEPSRPLSERRRHSSPMKDVAGMLRSFDYAAALVVRNAQSAASSMTRQRIATRYRNESCLAFLEGYRRAAAGLPHQWRSVQGEKATLALFTLEKALYEILYEYEHRPDWVDVPMQGLMTLVANGWELSS